MPTSPIVDAIARRDADGARLADGAAPRWRQSVDEGACCAGRSPASASGS